MTKPECCVWTQDPSFEPWVADTARWFVGCSGERVLAFKPLTVTRCFHCGKPVEEKPMIAPVNFEELDPGIRETVEMLVAHGFETTDSGDGKSKPEEWYESGEAMRFKHVVAVTTQARLFVDAERMATLLGKYWVIEAAYQLPSKSCTLFAREAFPEEMGDFGDDD